MSPQTASFVVPLSGFGIFFVVVFFNIYLAKIKIQDWKKYSTFFFLNTMATVYLRHTASLWIRKFGYDEADALRLATYQAMAMWESIVGIFIAFAIESNLLIR
jgi:hypothetical protein